MWTSPHPLFRQPTSGTAVLPQRSVTITYLELHPAAFKPRRLARSDVAFVHVEPPLPELNRFFYTAVGGHWFWLDRRHRSIHKLPTTRRTDTPERRSELWDWVAAAAGVAEMG